MNALARTHMTVSIVPPGYYAVAAVLGPGFFKISLLKLEVGFCWLDHGLPAAVIHGL